MSIKKLILLIFIAACSSPESVFLKKQREYYSILVKANLLTLENDYPGAFKLYDDSCASFVLIDDLSGFLDCRINLSLAHLRKGDKVKAENILHDAVEFADKFDLKKSQGRIFFNLALLYIKEKKFDQALARIDSSLHLLKRYEKEKEYYFRALSYKGYILIQLKRLSEAKKVLEEALDAENENIKSYVLINQARLYLSQSKFDQALISAEKALKIDKENARSSYIVYDYLILGRIFIKLKNQAKALHCFNRGLILAKVLKKERLISEFNALLKALPKI